MSHFYPLSADGLYTKPEFFDCDYCTEKTKFTNYNIQLIKYPIEICTLFCSFDCLENWIKDNGRTT